MRSRPVVEWTGHIAVVVASGPSAVTAPLELYRHRAKFIVVNDSWKLAPWADVLFACDEAWWRGNNGCSEFKGRRVTASPNCMKRYNIDLFCSTGTNSGLRAIFLAERLGANPICLVGFDMHPKNGVHWHKPYEQLRNPGPTEMRTWRNETEWAAARFKEKGVHVINCTPGSALIKYPYIPLAKVFAHAAKSTSATDSERHSATA
jgi:hypothetical protein